MEISLGMLPPHISVYHTQAHNKAQENILWTGICKLIWNFEFNIDTIDVNLVCYKVPDFDKYESLIIKQRMG